MKRILNTLFVIFLLVVLNNTAFSNSGEIISNTGAIINNTDKTKTIKELKKEVKYIGEKKEESDEKLDKLKKELLVNKFFKINLNDSEKRKLNSLIKIYKNKKSEINNQIIIESRELKNTDILKKQLLINEKDFYGKLIKYIDIKKYDEYIEYIKKNIIIVNNKSNLDSSSAQKEVIIQKKVDNIKDKIEEHNKIIKNNTIILLNNKINKILTKLTQKEKFKNLDNEGKVKLFDNLIKAINSKLEKLEKKENKSNIQIIIVENKNEILENIENFKMSIIEK